MGIVKPSAAVEQRWRGALEASVLQAPLELFLRSRSLEVETRVATRHSDNVTKATLHFLHLGFDSYRNAAAQSWQTAHLPLIGRTACLMSKTLANVIQQAECWRVAALRSITHVLTPTLGLIDAAQLSASLYRDFDQLQLTPSSPHEEAFCRDLEQSVKQNDEILVECVAAQFAADLAHIASYTRPVVHQSVRRIKSAVRLIS